MGVMGNIYITLIIPIPPITLNLWSYSGYNTYNLQQLKQKKGSEIIRAFFINISISTISRVK